MTTYEGFLAALEPDTARALQQAGRRRRWPAGATIFLEGEPGSSVVVLLEGRVKAYSTSFDGKEIILSLRGPGQLLGEIAALGQAGTLRSASVAAIEPTVGQVLTAAEFEAFLEAHPRASIVLLRAVLERLEQAVQMRLEYGAHDVLGRVARRLCELADVAGTPTPDGGVTITVALSQEELAGWVVASREAVARALGRLRTQGVISTDRKRIVVLDVARLRKLAAN